MELKKSFISSLIKTSLYKCAYALVYIDSFSTYPFENIDGVNILDNLCAINSCSSFFLSELYVIIFRTLCFVFIYFTL